MFGYFIEVLREAFLDVRLTRQRAYVVGIGGLQTLFTSAIKSSPRRGAAAKTRSSPKEKRSMAPNRHGLGCSWVHASLIVEDHH
jgi:hypothetical protein